jgi:hypothetical protein
MVLSWTADVIIDSFLMDSTIGRTAKVVARDGEEHRTAIEATRLFTYDAVNRIEIAGRNALQPQSPRAMSCGVMLAALKRFTKQDPLMHCGDPRAYC